MSVLGWVLWLLALAFAWTAVIVLDLALVWGLVATAALIALVGLLFVVRRLRARRAARRLERAIAAQGEAAARGARPDDADVAALKGEFVRAVGALKASRLGRGGTSALYALPWYVIVGPPGAGKSTALRASGLDFPYLSAAGGAIRGVGGTRNCDWWLTNEAILLDTAGRYTSDDDDRDEWLAFLDLLRTHRPRKPINGILVAVSLSELVRAGEREIGELARRLRARVDEVVERLELLPPVYLLVTKCDLLEGFVETFADLPRQERGQVWGFTLPLGAPAALGERVGAGFDELALAVRARALRVIGQERRLEARERILGFPQELELLRPQLVQLVTTLFAADVYRETPLARGVYFTSGTQEGRPIDRVMAAMAEAFGVAPELGGAPPVVEARSYFLRDVFVGVVFPDRDLAARTRRSTARRRVRLYAGAAAVLGVALMVSSLPAAAYVHNRALIGSTAAIVDAVARRRATPGAPPLTLADLEPLRARVDQLRAWGEDGPPARYRFGLYRGDDLAAPVAALYADVLRKDVLGPILADVEDALVAYARDPEGPHDPGHRDRLELYLLLSGPREAGEPPLDEARRDRVAAAVADAWAARLGEAGAPPPATDLEAMRAHARLFARLVAGDPRLLLARDAELVRRVRLALAAVPLEAIVLDPLIAEVSAAGYDLDLARILGGAAGPLTARATVRGAFTRRAWEQTVRARLAAAGGGDGAWVLGPQAVRVGDAAEQAARLRGRYLELYVQEWRGFLAALRVKPASSPIEAMAILSDLTRGVPPPYGRLIREVAFNAHLEEDGARPGAAPLPAGLLERAKKKLGKRGAAAADAGLAAARGDGDGGQPGKAGEGEGLLALEDVEAAFAPFTAFGVAPPPPPSPSQEGAAAAPPAQVLLDVYQEQLEFVRDALRTYLENPADGAPLAARLQEARTRVKGLIEQQDIGWRPRFEALLWPPIEGASVSTVSAMAAGKGLPWCNEVVVPFDRALKGRYPFAPNGHDAALADVADFYKPGGVVWAFHDQALAADVERVGEAFRFSRRLGGESGFAPALLTFLARSHEVTQVLFPAGAKEPTVELEVKINPSPGIASISFELDGQSVRTQNEPDRWFALRWPGPGKTRGAAIRVKGAQNLAETLRQDGEWGLFRLLEQGRLEVSPGSRVFRVTWALSSRPGVTVSFDVRPARNESPFFGLARPGEGRLLSPFRRAGLAPPHAIARGGGCAVR